MNDRSVDWVASVKYLLLGRLDVVHVRFNIRFFVDRFYDSLNVLGAKKTDEFATVHVTESYCLL